MMKAKLNGKPINGNQLQAETRVSALYVVEGDVVVPDGEITQAALAADTLANDIGVLGIRIKRAS